MKIDKYDQSTFLVLKAAYSYYILEKPQNQIAEELDVSVTTVSRLLKRAKDEKIIEFVIRNPYVECIKLEKELKNAFELQDVIIAPTIDYMEVASVENERSAKTLVALEAARYLQRIIKKDDVLGVTWGSTIYEMINYLNPSQKIDATFVTLHGSLASCDNEWDVRTLVMRMAKAFSGNKYILLTDALMSSEKTVRMLRKEKSIAQIFEMYKKVNISINGIGSFYPEVNTVLAKPGYLTAENVRDLQEKEVVGDIALRFFDKNGNECDTKLRDQTISIDFDTFKKIPQKVTIASGVFKAQTILYALRAKLIDVLIIDSRLGAELLKLNETI